MRVGGSSSAVCALYEEAGRLRLGLGTGGPWLRAHPNPDGVHYLVPDPANYYWPGNPSGKGGMIRWWQCTALLRMYDGEQVSGMLAVLPETFAALPSTLPRREQLRLVHLARATERDTYLWGRDHKASCGLQLCGYVPKPPTVPRQTPDEVGASNRRGPGPQSTGLCIRVTQRAQPLLGSRGGEGVAAQQGRCIWY